MSKVLRLQKQVDKDFQRRTMLVTQLMRDEGLSMDERKEAFEAYRKLVNSYLEVKGAADKFVIWREQTSTNIRRKFTKLTALLTVAWVLASFVPGISAIVDIIYISSAGAVLLTWAGLEVILRRI